MSKILKLTPAAKNDPLMDACLSYSKGMRHIAKNEPAEAIDEFIFAASIFLQLRKKKDAAICLIQAARSLGDLGKHSWAAKFFEKSAELQLGNILIANSLMRAAKQRFQNDEIGEAYDLFVRARKISTNSRQKQVIDRAVKNANINLAKKARAIQNARLTRFAL